MTVLSTAMNDQVDAWDAELNDVVDKAAKSDFLYCYVLYFERDMLLTIIALKSRIAHGSLSRLKLMIDGT